MDIAQLVRNSIEATITALGYEIVDVEYKHVDGDMHLSIYCDCATGFGLDDCEKINHAIDDILENLNPTNDQPYVLNVCSPGLDRPFKTPRDYARNIGKGVDIKLHKHFNKKLNIQGELLSHSEQEIKLMTPKGEVTIPMENVQKATPWVKFK